jgi:hypothetical protein
VDKVPVGQFTLNWFFRRDFDNQTVEAMDESFVPPAFFSRSVPAIVTIPFFLHPDRIK